MYQLPCRYVNTVFYSSLLGSRYAWAGEQPYLQGPNVRWGPILSCRDRAYCTASIGTKGTVVEATSCDGPRSLEWAAREPVPCEVGGQ